MEKLSKNQLFIDTSSRDQIVISIEFGDKRYEKISRMEGTKAQLVLPMIDELTREHDIKIEEIGSIQVASGPGSFTGLRVGLSVAQALSWLMDIPINSSPPGTTLLPTYE